MSILVPDASIVAKLFLHEAESKAVSMILASASSVTGPSTLAVEVASAITRRHRLNNITKDEALEALDEARAFFASASITLVSDALVQARAELIALDLRHPLRDCLFIALAEKEGADLISVDASLLKRASNQFPFVKAL